jgi:hypothetical protein
MSSESDSKPEVAGNDGYESWRIAQELVDVIGRPHTLFVGAIKMLLQPENSQQSAAQFARRAPLDLVFLTPSIKSVIYFAAAALHPEELPPPEELSGTSLLNVFSSEELAGVLAIAFLTSAFSKKIDKKLWGQILGEVQMQAEIGARVGAAIPAIGVGCGMLCGAMRYLAMTLFSTKDMRSFKAFLRQLETNDMLFDLKYEENKWGCNHLQIASLLLQQLGVGLGAANGICLAPGQNPDPASPQIVEITRWRNARIWIESLLQDERAPEGIDARGKFFPSEQALTRLQERIDSINLGGGTFGWTQKRREDMTPEVLSRLGIIARKSRGKNKQSDTEEAQEEVDEIL